MKPATERGTEYHDPSRIVRFVNYSKSEAEPDMLMYLCLPAVLIGTLLKIYYMYYVAIFVACASYLGCRYGEVNYQQYSSMGMMVVMACTMHFMQPARPYKPPTSQGGTPPPTQPGPPPQTTV
ncbi:hypothetical protein Esti_001499 [Eimeria stiedai]